ncbi:MAG: FHA domain-containing protein, partial [Fuerstia sp.]|nr:FHA domain-containing protein [Fuerstiella sp.]
GSQIVIDRAVVLVGRSADCDAIIDFSSKISRMHCVFVQVDTDYYIRDLGSMNGVRVNGERVEKAVKLTQGAEVAIGDVMFQFHANVQPAPRVAVRTQGGAKGMPPLVDKSFPVLDAEIIDEEVFDAEIIDVQVFEDADFVDDAQVVDVIQDVEVIGDVEVIDDLVEVVDFVEEIEVIDDIDAIDVIEDAEVIEDVEIIAEEPRRPRRPPRLR